MNYYMDDEGDVWKVDRKVKKYAVAELNMKDTTYTDAPKEWVEDYIVIHGLVEITEKEAAELLEGHTFLLNL